MKLYTSLRSRVWTEYITNWFLLKLRLLRSTLCTPGHSCKLLQLPVSLTLHNKHVWLLSVGTFDPLFWQLPSLYVVWWEKFESSLVTCLHLDFILFYCFSFFLIFLFLLYFTLQYCIGFAIHWHESTTGVYKLPILILNWKWIVPLHHGGVHLCSSSSLGSPCPTVLTGFMLNSHHGTKMIQFSWNIWNIFSMPHNQIGI